MAAKKCGAKTRSGTKCAKSAGWGTDHNGTGKCKLHGGASKGPPKGTQNALKHGIYARLFKPEELDAAAEMAGSVDTELAIARLNLAKLLEQQQKQGDLVVIDQIEEKTVAVQSDDTEAKVESLKKRRATDAKRCGEYYDPDEDDDIPEMQDIESAPFERKRILKRRDFQTELARLTALIARLEAQRLSMLLKQVELERAKKGGIDEQTDTEKLTSTELDNAILEAVEGLSASIFSGA